MQTARVSLCADTDTLATAKIRVHTHPDGWTLATVEFGEIVIQNYAMGARDFARELIRIGDDLHDAIDDYEERS
jgi:hypothetical protein